MPKTDSQNRKREAQRARAERELERALDTSLAKMKIRRTKAAVFLLSDEEMERLRKLWMPKHPKPLDVISFPEPNDFPHPGSRGRRYLGEIMLNWDVLQEDPDHLKFLAVHGLLHLLGFTHEGKGDTMKMQKREREFLNTVSAPRLHAIKSRYRHRYRNIIHKSSRC